MLGGFIPAQPANSTSIRAVQTMATRNALAARGGRCGSEGSRGYRPATLAPQYTLVSLVAELRERAEAGEPQRALVEWLYSLARGLGVQMRFDEHAAAGAAQNAAEPLGGQEASAPPASVVETGSAGDGFQRVGGRSRGKRQAARRKARQAVSAVITRGRLRVEFGDAALQEREPPASGRFDHLLEGDTFVGRIILSCDRRKVRVDAPLCAECNGAVIDARTWTHLVVPPRAFAPRPSAKTIDQAFAAPDSDGAIRTGHYSIVQASDGTVVTLYCWTHPVKGPIWCLASSHGYDVSHLKWMGDKTYAEIVYDLLAACPGFLAAVGLELTRGFLCENDVRLGFKRLDRGRCYTVGFRHPNFHPMAADPPGVWNIQAADLATGIPEYCGDKALVGLPAVPRQALYSREDIIRLAAATGHRGGLDGTGLRVADLDRISQTALEDAKAVIAGKAPAPARPSQDAGIYTCPFNYGFILRSRNPEATGAYSDILCESPLLRRVRQLVYQRPSRQVREELDESSRLEYNALKAYLTVTDRDDFLALFPGFKPRFALYEQFVNNVVHLVIHMQRQSLMAPDPGFSENRQLCARTKAVARAMLDHILHHEDGFSPFHRDARSVVHDFVVCPEYATPYLRAIGLSPPCGE